MTHTLSLHTQNDSLAFDPQTARLVSFRRQSAPNQEFIAFSEQHPAFVIGYFDEQRAYHQLDSLQAASVRVEQNTRGDNSTIHAHYRQIAGLKLDVQFSVTAARGDPFSRWKINLDNSSGLEIINVQFPFVVCAFDLAGAKDSESLALPHGYTSGQLIKNFKGEESVQTPFGVMWRRKLKPDTWTAWLWSDWNTEHYPGWQFAQFLAYYNDRAGLYLACNDTQGGLKSFKILDREPGFRLALAHIGDWPQDGARSLEYDTLLGSFEGDWYDAAEIYRSWSLQQKWATPLHRRNDVPAWLLDSPVYVTVRPQGVLDEGPVFPVEEFLPYEKVLPLLDGIAQKVEAPIAAVLMSWERAGSWVYPDCFPPIGGEESIANFTRLARQRGWHVGSFSNGTQWLIGDGWNGYNGQEYFQEHDGEAAVCRRPDGSGWLSTHYWRPGYPCCMGAPLTRQIAKDYVRRLVGWGFESIQFFDQNCFAVTFACFSKDHEHPPLPGRWMNEKMADLAGEFQAITELAGEASVIQSTESGVNEYCLPLFQEADLRVFPPGWEESAGFNPTIPLFQYLFHECVILNGMMSAGQEPYHVEISAAANGVLGGIPGGVLRGDGTLMDKDTNNWAPWEPKIGDPEAGLEMLRTVTALRCGAGKDFLVFGRMLRPFQVEGIQDVAWSWKGRKNRTPAVFHSAWQAPDGRTGVVLANWTDRRRTVHIHEDRFAIGLAAKGNAEINLTLSGRQMRQKPLKLQNGEISLTIPAHACALLEI
jgi:hypothetical protein